MADEVKPIGVDATGFEVLSKAILETLNQYPSLNGKEILFEELTKDGGIAMSADNGALIMTERRSITDHVFQTCQFPFFVVYRTASTRESQKLQVQTFLDALGKWLCKEPASPLAEACDYPALTDGRRITRITRSNAYGLQPNPNGTQDWLLPVTVQYTNEFDMW